MGKFQIPFSSLFAKITNDNRFFCVELDRTWSKVEHVGKVNHGSFADGHNRYYEFLSLSYNYQLVLVVDFGLGGKSYNKFSLHSCCYFGACLYFACLVVVGQHYLEKFGIGLNDLDSS